MKERSWGVIQGGQCDTDGVRCKVVGKGGGRNGTGGRVGGRKRGMEGKYGRKEMRQTTRGYLRGRRGRKVMSKLAFRPLTAQLSAFRVHRDDSHYSNKCLSISIRGRRLDL